MPRALHVNYNYLQEPRYSTGGISVNYDVSDELGTLLVLLNAACQPPGANYDIDLAYFAGDHGLQLLKRWLLAQTSSTLLTQNTSIYNREERLL